nr:DUF2627 domain-containing protein [Bacillus kwashiorkori]
MVRLIALIIVVIPGIVAALGVKLMRDSVFGVFQWPFQSIFIQFFIGLLFFFAGVGLIGGFIFHRDKKRNKVQKRFQSRLKNANRG